MIPSELYLDIHIEIFKKLDNSQKFIKIYKFLFIYINVWLLELFNKKKMGSFQILQNVLTVKYTLVLDIIIRISVQILGIKKKAGFLKVRYRFLTGVTY